MIVQHAMFNIADERPIEYALWDRDVSCYRCEWRDVLSQTELQADGTLLFRFSDSQPDCEVSVVTTELDMKLANTTPRVARPA